MQNPIYAAFERAPIAIQNGLLADYDFATYMAILATQYANQPGTLLVQSCLRVEAILGNQNTVDFNIGETANASASEVRLNINDNFHLVGYSFGLVRATTTVPVGKQQIHYFANPQVFPEATELEAIYNGTLNMVMNARQVVKNLPMQNAKFVQEAQQLLGTATAAPATPAGSTAAYAASSNTQERIVKCRPTLMINGSSNPKMTIQLPQGANMAAAAANNFNVCVGYLYGFLAQTAH